eukprot:1158398-Pelagomonas_calceolata.AAC.5
MFSTGNPGQRPSHPGKDPSLHPILSPPLTGPLQLFHNRQPDRDNLAKSTARFLSHNGRQGPSSRPAAIDQADISLQVC